MKVFCKILAVVFGVALSVGATSVSIPYVQDFSGSSLPGISEGWEYSSKLTFGLIAGKLVLAKDEFGILHVDANRSENLVLVVPNDSDASYLVSDDGVVWFEFFSMLHNCSFRYRYCYIKSHGSS